ncbi:MAG: DUF2809 domain-containing protein [Lachnospiraceae bacterium]|nr:DUF2809 domain-containing protein [Lachnospiraceae bacterium]
MSRAGVERKVKAGRWRYFVIFLLLLIIEVLIALYVFFFAAGVEGLQYFNLVRVLGLEENVFLRVLIGSVFDWKDILCYAAGCVVLEGYERIKKTNATYNY